MTKLAKIITAFIVVLFFAPSSFAQQNAWSFKDNPYPKANQLSEQERQMLNSKKEALNNIENCEELEKIQYKIYQNHYSKFQKYADDGDNFERWKLYMIKSGNYLSCSLLKPMQLLVDRDSELEYEHFYFCGQFSRPAQNEQEKQVAKVITQLFENAKTGSPAAVDILLYANENSEIINLTPDIEYYFSVLAKPFLKENNERDLSHLYSLISEEKQEFIKEAAQNLDIDSVLATSLPCKKR